jgi:ankyrin repeat protein
MRNRRDNITATTIFAGGHYINECHGFTQLMIAVVINREDIVRKLINLGADITIKNNDGDTAVELARKLGRTSICELLHPLDCVSDIEESGT